MITKILVILVELKKKKQQQQQQQKLLIQFLNIYIFLLNCLLFLFKIKSKYRNSNDIYITSI